MLNFSFSSLRVKPAIFDLLLAVCIAAYLGMVYLAIQVSVTLFMMAPFRLIRGHLTLTSDPGNQILQSGNSLSTKRYNEHQRRRKLN